MFRTRGGERGAFGRTGSLATMVAEPDHSRVETAVSAYCRELCGPASPRAVREVLATLESGPDTLSETDLLRTTRATAARFAFPGLDGSRGKLTAMSSSPCALTPERLTAQISDTLAPLEQRELAAHLEGCLPCTAIRIKLDRAERGFAVLWSSPTAIELVETIAPAAPDAAVARAGGPIGEPLELDGERSEAAARAYCRELCGPTSSERAVAAILAALVIGARSQTVDVDELLRVTRLAAAEQASDDIGALILDEESAAACPEATIALGARANGELSAGAQLRLGAHVQHCLVCLATQVKMARAERAFSTMATAAPGIELRLDTRAGAGPRRAAREPSPIRPDVAWAPPPPVDIAAAVPFAEPTTDAPLPPSPLGVPIVTLVTPRVPPGRSDRDRLIRTRRLVAATVALAAAAAVASAVVLSGHSSRPTISPAAQASLTKAAHTSPTPTRARATTVSRAAPAQTPRHRVPTAAHRAVKVQRKAAPQHVTSAPAVHTPAAAPRVVVPVTPTRAVSLPVTSRPSTSTAKQGLPSATPQGSSLPAQSAPIKGIGSSGG